MRTVTDLAQAIADNLAAHIGQRVWTYMADTVLPPAVVVERPTITWSGAQRTFGTAQWVWPITLIAARSHDRSAHDDLDRLIAAVEAALGDDPTLGGAADHSELTSAEPVTATSGGQDLPAYQLTLTMIA